MDSCLKIVLLCGLLLIASLQTTNGLRFRRSTSEKTDLEKNIHHLLKHYKTLGTEHVTKSVFASYLDQLKIKTSCTCQSLLLERMLNIYEGIFQDMKSDQKYMKNNEVKKIQYVIDEVEKLSKKYSEEHKEWNKLQAIHSHKGKNGTQVGALNDFLMVFKRAEKEKHENENTAQ